MISTRNTFLAITALGFLTSAAAADEFPSIFALDSQMIRLAQAEVEPAEMPENPVEADPVALAEQAVDDARATLRQAMATGGDVRGARRQLQAAIQQLNQARNAQASQETTGDTAEKDIVPSDQATTGEPSAAVPTLALPEATPTPQDPALTPAPTPELPAAAPTATATPPQPPRLAPLALPTQQEPQASPPPASSEAIPETPAETTAEGPVPTAPDDSGSAAATEDSQTQTQADPAPDDEKPGFFRRIFGGGGDEPEKPTASDQDAKPAPQSDTAASQEPDQRFKKLPPVPGPKIVIAPDNAEIVEKEDDKRVIVRENGRVTIRHDDNDRFRRRGEDITVEKGPRDNTVTTITRPNGTEIVTIRDSSGDIIRRTRKKANGQVDVLIGERDRQGRPRQGQSGPDRPARNPAQSGRPFDLTRSLPKLVVPIPQGQYIVGSQGASRNDIQKALIAPPVEAIERPYTLEEIRRTERLRAKLRRIDVDTVNFEFGASTIAQDQIVNLQVIGNALAAIIADDPNEVFLIEGHTDAVGSNYANLALSDRRAESIAEILTYYFDIPPENLISQGYGEQYLKVLTAGPERTNRRASVRRITPLIVGQL